MKKVIKGKIYDTEKAQRLGEYEPNPYRSDFHWFCETFYKKRTGEFFLHGEGHAASKYNKSCGQNEWCGDEKIVPLTYEEAQAWAEEHLDGDEYVEIFGEPEEDGTKTALNIYVRSDVAKWLKTEASKQGKSIGDIIESLIK